MSLNQTPPYTENDVAFLKMCRVDPWRHDGRNFKQSYPQYDHKREIDWPRVVLGIGIAGLLGFYICVINWAIPLVVKR